MKSIIRIGILSVLLCTLVMSSAFAKHKSVKSKHLKNIEVLSALLSEQLSKSGVSQIKIGDLIVQASSAEDSPPKGSVEIGCSCFCPKRTGIWSCSDAQGNSCGEDGQSCGTDTGSQFQTPF